MLNVSGWLLVVQVDVLTCSCIFLTSFICCRHLCQHSILHDHTMPSCVCGNSAVGTMPRGTYQEAAAMPLLGKMCKSILRASCWHDDLAAAATSRDVSAATREDNFALAGPSNGMAAVAEHVPSDNVPTPAALQSVASQSFLLCCTQYKHEHAAAYYSHFAPIPRPCSVLLP